MGHIGNYMETIDGRIVDSKDLSAGVKMLFGKEKEDTKINSKPKSY